MEFVLIGLAVIAWLFWGGRKSGGSRKIGKGKSVPAKTRVPRSKIPMIDGGMFSPVGVPFSEADALEAFGKFLRHVGWMEDLDDRTVDFETAMADHVENLSATSENMAELLVHVAEELHDLSEELSSDDDPLTADERAEYAARKRPLVAAKRRYEKTKLKADGALAAFRLDSRPFLVAYLNHEIHGRKSPVAPFEYEST